MKNALIICILLISFTSFAQRPHGNNDRPSRYKMDRPEYTPDQIAEIKTKKMTLMLDLNETQQTKIMALELEAAKARELKFSEKKSDEKPSDEERFKMQSERLDRQIAHKKSMKSILTKTQFEKWEKSMPAKGKRRNQKGRKGMKGEKRQ